MKKCPKCGGNCYKICNTCGVWLPDCEDKKNHKDKAWVCVKCQLHEDYFEDYEKRKGKDKIQLYESYAKAARNRKRNEMAIFDINHQKYKNTKIEIRDTFGRKIK